MTILDFNSPVKHLNFKSASASIGGAPHTAGMGGGQGPVLLTAKYVGELVGELTPADYRKKQFLLQRAAAKLCPDSRTGLCLWCVASNEYGVDVINNRPEKKARFNGLQTCGSVWSCPVCSATVSRQRQQEMNDLLSWGRTKGYSVVMLTLTLRHTQADSLLASLTGLKNANRRLQQHSAYKTFKTAHLVGSVTATEVVGGGVNGWHPHFHKILILRCAQADAIKEVEKLRTAWITSLEKEGCSGKTAAFHVQDGNTAGKYISKWGAAEELTLGQKKSARAGSTPFQLLDAYTQGDKRAGALFAEYAKVFKGRCQLVWSNGLKKLASIKEISDERAAEDSVRLMDMAKNDERVGHFTPKVWASIRHQRASILKMAEAAGEAGVDAVVKVIKLQKSKKISSPPSTPLPKFTPPPPSPPPVSKATLLPMYQKFNNHPLIKEWADEWDRTDGGRTK
jgi:hypothetical protein